MALNIVAELKNDHTLFLGVLDSIKTLGAEDQKKLVDVKKTFLDHLKKEDQSFYPVLLKASESDAGLKSKLSMFAGEMDKISSDVMSFFDRLEKGASAADLAKDWGRLVFQLKTRMRREEDMLYPEFEKLKK